MQSAVETQTLSDRQQRFVFEYLKDQNASAAAVRAGYLPKSRASQASELMQNPAVRERVRMELQSLLAELRCSALDLMKERMRAAFFRAGKLFDASGRLLGFEEMEAEVRDSLVISAKWRKGEPEISFRQPNREPALRALERVHERLERLNEQHYEKLERQAQALAQPIGPAAAWPVQPAQAAQHPGMDTAVNDPATAVAMEQASAAASAKPVPTENEAEAALAPANSAPACTTIGEKPRVLSGLPEKPGEHSPKESCEHRPAGPGPEKPAKLSVFAKALAALSPGKKEQALPKRQAPPPIQRRDPGLLWGGPRKYTPPEPSPALLEHLARLRHEELNAEASGRWN